MTKRLIKIRNEKRTKRTYELWQGNGVVFRKLLAVPVGRGDNLLGPSARTPFITSRHRAGRVLDVQGRGCSASACGAEGQMVRATTSVGRKAAAVPRAIASSQRPVYLDPSS